MDKKKQKLIITGVLLVVMVLMAGRALFGGKKGGAPSQALSSQPSVSIETMAANMAFLASIRQSETSRLAQETEWEKPWGRDPFSFSLVAGKAAAIEGNFVLSGIVWDQKQPLAIINQVLLKASDSIDGCLVKEIHRSSVTLACSEKTFEVQLFHHVEPAEPAEETQDLS